MGRLFGTDGVRGIANSELSCLLAFNIGRAAASTLSDREGKRPVILIGGDTRCSTPMLTASVISGISSVGADVIELGVIPTPAVSYLVGKYRADAGIVISASHNTFEYNGIKIFGSNGQKLPDMLEERIESIVLDNSSAFPCPTGNGIGRILQAPEAAKDYIEKVAESIDHPLDGMKLALDCANGAASRTAERLFKKLGAEVHMLSDTPDGININRDSGSTHMSRISEFVRGKGLDGGAAFDGDADRCLCVDERGDIVDGDTIMAICALDLNARGLLKNNTVVGTVMTNLGFQKFCEQNGLHFTATKVGDRFVLEEMILGDYSFGGEQSGHIIFRDFAATGDGQLTAVQLFSYVKRAGRPLSELSKVMKPYPQSSFNVKVSNVGKLQFYTDPIVKESIDRAKKELGDNGRIVVRPSGTEPLIRIMVEFNEKATGNLIAERVAEVIQGVLGEK